MNKCIRANSWESIPKTPLNSITELMRANIVKLPMQARTSGTAGLTFARTALSVVMVLLASIAGQAEAQSSYPHPAEAFKRKPSPFWVDINSRFTPQQVVEKILALANEPRTSVKEVEEIFGVKFRPESNAQNGMRWHHAVFPPSDATAEKANLTYPAILLRVWGEERSFFTIVMSGISDGVDVTDCIVNGAVIDRLIKDGWMKKTEPPHDQLYFAKETTQLRSRIWIGQDSFQSRLTCLNAIDISNSPSPRSYKD